VISRDRHDPDGPLVERQISRTYQRTAYAFKGGFEDVSGIYHIGNQEWDSLTGSPLSHDPAAYWDQQIPHTPTGLSIYFANDVTPEGWMAWTGGAAQVVGTAALFTAGILAFPALAPFALVAGLGFLGYQGYQGYTEYGGAGGALVNITGVAPIYESWTDKHWRTEAELGRSDFERGALLAGGLLQLGGTAYVGGRLIAAAPRPFGYQWSIVGQAEADGSFVFGTNRFFRPQVRLPVAGPSTSANGGGHWVGERGDGVWFSYHPSVQQITRGLGIPFKNGRVDFSQWSRKNLNVVGLDGSKKDFGRVYSALASELNLESASAARLWLVRQGLTPHHVSGEVIQLVPKLLHKNVRHTGGAFDLRFNGKTQ
jgi:hypothetical protein